MKIGGILVDKPTEEILVIQNNGNDIVFKAQAVLDYTEFDEICVKPEPPSIIKRGEKVTTKDFEDKKYNQEVYDFAVLKTNWMYLKSLEPSEIEWKTVKMKKPETWANYKNELKKIFTTQQVEKIFDLVLEANVITDSKIKEGRERFLAGERVTVNP